MQNIVKSLNHKLVDNVDRILGLFDKLKPPNNPWYITSKVNAIPYFLKNFSNLVNSGTICNISNIKQQKIYIKFKHYCTKQHQTMHLFQKYTHEGSFADCDLLFNILQTMKTICIVGTKNVGKKTLISKISKFYKNSFYLDKLDNFHDVYNFHFNENILKQTTSLLYFYYNPKYHNSIVSKIKLSNQHIHLIILGSPNIFFKFSSFCFIYRIKIPSYQMKIEVLNKISSNEYNHIDNVETIARNFFTYHDCILALELYEHGIYNIHSYEECIQQIVDEFVIKKKMTRLQLRNILYNLMMHISDFAEIVKYVASLLYKKNLFDHLEISKICAQVEYDFVYGNKEVYHYENLFNQLQMCKETGKKMKIKS